MIVIFVGVVKSFGAGGGTVNTDCIAVLCKWSISLYEFIMFAQVFRDVAEGEAIEPDLLARRFDLAMTKKLGVVKLPSTFWVQDPKINPRADHLLWAALLLEDAQRVALACSVLAVEHEEQQKRSNPGERMPFSQAVDGYLRQLLDLLPGKDTDRELRLRRLVDSLKT